MADSIKVKSGLQGVVNQLARAIATDAVHLAPQLEIANRVLGIVAKFTVASCVVICWAAAVAVLWALARVPADDGAAVAPSVLVEAARGEPLGRVGP